MQLAGPAGCRSTGSASLGRPLGMNDERSASPAQRLYWWCQFVGWGLYGASTSYSLALIGAVSWLHATAAAGVIVVIGIAFSHGLRLFMRRRGWRTMRMRM